jgi:hypothetical protein
MQIQNPNESRERVAFDLMTKIAQEEANQKKRDSDSREYYLLLYSQCLKIVSGEDLEDIIESEESEETL